jgi:hypothetical protein
MLRFPGGNGDYGCAGVSLSGSGLTGAVSTGALGAEVVDSVVL